jgi:hypothetical protein
MLIFTPPRRTAVFLAERPRLAEQGVDKGGLPVVDVGDHRHVAEIVAGARHRRKGTDP